MRFPVGKDNEDFKLNWYSAQGYGNSTDYGFHEGEDFNLKTGGDTDLGQPIYAIADGRVSSVHSHTTGFGYHLHIRHDSYNCWSHYAHCKEILVKADEQIREGQLIATLGKSGTTYAHLHFAIKNQPTGIDGIAKTKEDLKKWEDPIPFIEKHMNNKPFDYTITKGLFDYLSSILGSDTTTWEGAVRGWYASHQNLTRLTQEYESEKTKLTAKIKALEELLATDHNWADVADGYQRKLEVLVDYLNKNGQTVSVENDGNVLLSALQSTNRSEDYKKLIDGAKSRLDDDNITTEAILEALEELVASRDEIKSLKNKLSDGDPVGVFPFLWLVVKLYNKKEM